MSLDSISQIASTTSSISTTLVVVVAVWQLRQNRKLSQTQFEDSLEREYREIIKELPYSVFIDSSNGEFDRDQYMDDFYRYFDFTNSEIVLRKNNRVGLATWNQWKIGIKENMTKQSFRTAFSEITRDNPAIFSELAKLITESYRSDPQKWPKRRSSSAS